MPGVQYINEGEKRIFLIDLVGISDYLVLPNLVAEATRLVQMGHGPGSVRTLVDLTDTRINRPVISSLKSLSRNNGRYARATAFVGLGNIWSLALSTLLRARGKKNHRVFQSRSEALLWLEQQ